MADRSFNNFEPVTLCHELSFNKEPIMAKKDSRTRYYDGDYSGRLNQARRMEENDFEMISEDHKACANLPQEVKYHAWPEPGYYAETNLDDTIRGITKQQNADGEGMRRNKAKSKY